MIENTLYHKEAKRVKFDIEDFARGKCIHDDAQILLYVRLRSAGHAAFDSFVSAFPQFGGHPDDLSAAAAAFERSAVYRSAFERVIERGDRDALRAEWQHIAHVARGRTSAARAAIERATASAFKSAADEIEADKARAITAGMAKFEPEAVAARRAAEHKMMEESINSDAPFTFVK